MCFFSFAARVLFYIYGTILPAFYTFRALSNGNENDFSLWAKYWIVYAFIATIQVLADVLISWLPLYGITKMALILWIVFTAPAANVWIFNSILGPLLFKHEKRINLFLLRGKHQMLNEFFSWGTHVIIRSRTIVAPVFCRLLNHCRQRFEKAPESKGSDCLEKYEMPDDILEAVPDTYPDAERQSLVAAAADILVDHSSKDESGELEKKNGLSTESMTSVIVNRKRYSNTRSSKTNNQIQTRPAVLIPKDEVNDETENLLAKSQKESNGRIFSQFLNPRSGKI